MENSLVIHRWSPSDIRHASYTVNELRTLHRSLGPDSVNALSSLLETSSEIKIDKMIKNALEKI